MPKFFGPTARVKPDPTGNIDPFGLANQCTKPIVTAVQGICYTAGIEHMLAGDMVVAARDARFCQMEAKRGIAPLRIHVIKTAGHKFIEAGEQAAVGVISEIKAKVLNGKDAAEGIQSIVESRAAVVQGH